MKRKIIYSALLFLIIISGFLLFKYNDQPKENTIANIESLRKKHQHFLDNSPYKDVKNLSRKERKALGLPPNAYNDQVFELTMDPNTGRPMLEHLEAIQKELIENRVLARGVGGQTSMPWIDRGPNNQGGRTRGIMFDPNDVGNANPADDFTRVFAGGVSGGLWVNNDITNSNSSWTLVTGIQQNIAVNVIISDPNDSNTFYIGSGESYTSGQAVGNGVWKSTDGGSTWSHIFGGYDSFSSGNGFVNGIFYINDIVARNNAGVTELYAGVASAFYSEANSPNNFNGVNEMGLYKSIDGGQNWARFEIRHADNSFKNPCDIELDINNNIWFTTTSNSFGNAGGDIYRSTDGIAFTLIRTIPGAARTELEPSPISVNRFWVAADVGGQADLFTTTDAFASISNITEPDDADNGISPTDYTRGQAFYDLVIEAGPNNNLYVGGIDLFRSNNNGISWTQISKWSNNPNLNTLQVPLVHADQHAITFRPGSNGAQAVFGNDGGVYYSSNTAFNAPNASAIQARNRDYNTIQFYNGSLDTTIATDNLGGGTQDNGTQFVENALDGANGFFDPVGGDGGFTEFAGNGQYVITTYPGNNHIYINYPILNNSYLISSGTGGSFINEAALDKSLNILYTNATDGGNRRIERISNFTTGQANIQTANLTNALLNSSPSALKVSPYTTATTTLFAGLRNGRLLKVTLANFSPNWSNISGPSFVGSISDIEFGQNEQEIFVTMHNYGVQSVWFTANGGTTWTSIEGNLPDIPVKCILQNPLIPNELIIGTDLGVWATPDYTVPNPSWVQVYNGMSNVPVLDLDLRASDNTILASTHGRGMFTSQFTAVPLSITDNTLEDNKIKLFPTVSNGSITIASNSNIGNVDFTVFNLSGQKVYSSKIDLNGNNTNINLKLSSGMYMVKFTKGTFSETKKIIIK